MFVPAHRRRAAAAGKKSQVRSKRAALLGVVAAVTAAMISNLARAGASHRGGGNGTAVWLTVGIGAAVLGLVLARAIGRQGKI
jgi:hypothetical protein